MKNTELYTFLQFTGNWFIDAGILGFVNLMEEVYGWDLEELQERIKENEDIVYYGYFPIAYVHYNNYSYLENEKRLFYWLKTKDLKFPEFKNALEREEIFSKVWKFIEKHYKNKDKIKLSFSGKFVIFTNFLFFQPKWKVDQQREAFREILELKNFSEETLIYVDKTINKFLPSKGEFQNLLYGKSFITVFDLKKVIKLPLVFLLTFPLGFEKLGKENFCFYAPELKFSYKVNKKLKILEELSNKEKKSSSKRRILTFLWREVIDALVETKSLWTLENMYIIEYQMGQNQNLLKAEYIGIPKLQASVLIDDKIRDALNCHIQLGKGAREAQIWLIEKFIKGEGLYEKILKHTNYALKQNKNPGFKASLYALAIDAKIKENAENSSKALFSNDFFRGYKFLVDEIKETYLLLASRANLISQLFENEEEKSKLVYPLFSALKKKNRISFVNTLLKKFTELSKKENLSPLIKFIFENIISNDVSWENYALALIIGILTSRGGENGGEIHEE